MHYRLNKIFDWVRRRGKKRDLKHYVNKLASMASENRRILRELEKQFFIMQDRLKIIEEELKKHE